MNAPALHHQPSTINHQLIPLPPAPPMQPTTSPPLADPQEVFLREDCQATAHLPAGMPVCRFERYEDPGDPNHGIPPFGGWQLSQDQVGTLLCLAIAQQETLSLIAQLRAEEGDHVTLFCDNADFNGQPNCLIMCIGGWTQYLDKQFAGDTLLDCLRAAMEDKQRGQCSALPIGSAKFQPEFHDEFSAEIAIAAILNNVRPPLNRLSAAELMLFRIRYNEGEREFRGASVGPNPRYKQDEAEELCRGLKMRATLPDDSAVATAPKDSAS